MAFKIQTWYGFCTNIRTKVTSLKNQTGYAPHRLSVSDFTAEIVYQPINKLYFNGQLTCAV